MTTGAVSGRIGVRMSDIGCQCICDSGYDEAEFYKVDVVTARKEHTCCECGDPILPGEKYEKARGVWGGGFEEYKTCFVCRRIRDDVCACGWLFGGLREAIFDAHGVDYVTGETDEDDDDD